MELGQSVEPPETALFRQGVEPLEPEPFPEPSGPETGGVPRSAAARRASRRRALLFGGAGALVVGLGVGGAVLALSGDDEPEPTTPPPAPVVSILAGPCTSDPLADEPVGGCETSATSATFEFEATGKADAFDCAVDAGRFVECASPQVFKRLGVGEHSFRVRGNGPGGRGVPATFEWTIIEVPSGPLPDLVVTFLDSTRVVVENQGDGDAGQFVVDVGSVASFSVRELPAGGIKRTRLPACAPGELVALVDAEGTVVESDEDNNQVTQGPFTCPDLVVSEVTQTSVTVENRGDGPASPSSVLVDPLGTFDVPSLGAGDVHTEEFECAEGPLEAAADQEQEVLESDEGNNTLSAGPFVCQSPTPSEEPLADLVVANLDATSVTVTNIGEAPAGESVVEVEGVGPFTIGPLGPDESQTQTYPCTEAALTATADATGVIEESDEDNNALTAGPFECPKPDLTVSALDATVISVANVGGAASGPSLVTVSPGGTFDVPALGVGEEVTFSFSECPATSVTATVDPREQVEESDEENNTLTGGPFECPDLVVEFDSSGGFLTVTNQGTGPAGASRLAAGTASFEVPPLNPNEQFTQQFCGERGGVATTDADSEVFESDEDNNGTQAGECDTID